eukprot:CAMPEP_0206188860 /NCGR_PEP_ID=MMETSP0166-20121206/3833_1 /ASSEMBLY_ACC=CAM_ASM_000260 /TAXON_ID=95228 /ORGANISM="Vannella robusta, Strain DIVA3 518/3/11/1/6" /LENGTH=401 /DNA_ID=CAMNT_0053604683 /DNA_START=876 /DNA_END=2078 /DNA_ORIENTATION=-
MADSFLVLSGDGSDDEGCGTFDFPCRSMKQVLLEHSNKKEENTPLIVKILPGVYSSEKDININLPNVPLTIEGLSNEVTFDCENRPSSFAFTATSQVEMSQIIINNCVTAIKFLPEQKQTLILEEVQISQCDTAVHATNGGVVIANSSFGNLNSALEFIDTDVQIESSLIDNTSTGIQCTISNENQSTLKVEHTVFQQTTTPIQSDSANDIQSLQLTLSDSEFSKCEHIDISVNTNGMIRDVSFLNSATRVLSINAPGVWTFDNIQVQNSGGIEFLHEEITAEFIQSSFSSNTASNGAAIYFAGSQLTLTDSSFEENHAVKYGAGIFMESGVCVMDGVQFTENKAKKGSAIFCEHDSFVESNKNDFTLQNNANMKGDDVACPMVSSSDTTSDGPSPLAPLW